MWVKQPYALAAALLWIGFVGAISFMEAWLKFRAPGITLSLGLGIGRIVFSALNKVEWVLAAVIALQLVVGRAIPAKSGLWWFSAAFVILMMQTFWMLPALDARAELHIQHQEVPRSHMHFYYIAAELFKMIFLIGFSLTQFQNSKS